jgi:hypothetical protein
VDVVAGGRGRDDQSRVAVRGDEPSYLESLCADIHLGRGDLDRAYQETIDGAT